MFINDFGVIVGPIANSAALSKTLLNRDLPYDQNVWLCTEGQYAVSRIATELPSLPDNLVHYDCRNNRLALAVLHQISATIMKAREEYGPSRVGVVMGTSTSGIAQAEKAVASIQSGSVHPENYHVVQNMLGGLASFIGDYLRLCGPAYSVSTACSSAANAFGSARRLLELGICDAVVVGGVDSHCELTLGGFGALEALSTDICRPFTQNRDGINLGEAGAIFLVSQKPAELLIKGIGCSSDAHHISAPHPGGEGAYQAMTAALENAGLTADDIGYLNLHGTGTALNDTMESKAVNRLFGESLPCSSTKCFTGHTLGAAGALELAICAQAMLDRNAWLPAQPHLQERDLELAPIALLKKPFNLHAIENSMSNSFAFGGNNVSLILGRTDG